MNVRSIGRNIENLGTSGAERDENVIQSFSVDQVRRFRPTFSFLNGKDLDILYLIFVARKKQCQVQEILRRSQPSLCYDIRRIRRRLRFIRYLNSVSDIFMCFIREYKEQFPEEDIEVLTLMFYTSSFTQTAKILKMSQVRVRYIYEKCLRRLEDEQIWEAYEIFTVIRKNLNIIRRTYRRKSDSQCQYFVP